MTFGDLKQKGEGVVSACFGTFYNILIMGCLDSKILNQKLNSIRSNELTISVLDYK